MNIASWEIILEEFIFIKNLAYKCNTVIKTTGNVRLLFGQHLYIECTFISVFRVFEILVK